MGFHWGLGSVTLRLCGVLMIGKARVHHLCGIALEGGSGIDWRVDGSVRSVGVVGVVDGSRKGR